MVVIVVNNCRWREGGEELVEPGRQSLTFDIGLHVNMGKHCTHSHCIQILLIREAANQLSSLHIAHLDKLVNCVDVTLHGRREHPSHTAQCGKKRTSVPFLF